MADKVSQQFMTFISTAYIAMRANVNGMKFNENDFSQQQVVVNFIAAQFGSFAKALKIAFK